MSMERCPECSSVASERGCSELAGGTAGRGFVKKVEGLFCKDRSGLWVRLIGAVIGDWYEGETISPAILDMWEMLDEVAWRRWELSGSLPRPCA